MKINQNISAVVVNEQLLRNENSLAESLQRLSSGLKFNNPRDNPSGVAISYKMQAQINALDRASANATDGTSIVQTIDGSIGEMTDVLQRMRELCVQAASDTNTPADKEAIQQEISSLKTEVDRISRDTEFNGKTLLDGSLDRRSYVTATREVKDGLGNVIGEETYSAYKEISNVIISDEVPAKEYEIKIEKNPTHAVLKANAYTGGVDGTISINGSLGEIRKDMTPEEVYKVLRDTGKRGGVNVFARSDDTQELKEETLDTQGFKDVPFTGAEKLTFVTEKYGTAGNIKISGSDELLNALGIDPDAVEAGEDTKVSVVSGEGTGFSTENVITTKGEQVTITDRSGFKMDFQVRGDFAKDGEETITLDVTDKGTLQLQIGANEDQELAVRVPILNTKSLYIDKLDVTRVGGASEGIALSDVALETVSAARAKIGAYQNSLERIEASLDANGEDMTRAISRLEDTDMAKEMSNYSSLSVLTQASTSILGQANDLPQQVLSLLQF